MKSCQNFPVGVLVLVLPENPGEVEKQAALELRNALFQMSRKQVPVLGAKHSHLGDRIGLYFGGRAAQQSGFRLSKLPGNTVEISRLNQHNFIFRGEGERGLLEAIYTWLEFLGCRWFHPQVSFYPRRETVPIPENFHYTASFAYRDALWKVPGEDGDWSSRNRLNGCFAGLEKRHGRFWGWEPFTHSFYQMVPPRIYG
ncbi:MAG: hypothetical protein NC911_08800, partial [Candidatus Omnitrophica bacterium]|nr:hypothetical protein [Candidatus Omnitrophota bacterium]